MTDLTTCPAEIAALDPNAENLWPVFLRRTGVSMSVDRTRVIDNQSHRALIVRSFGIASLVQRLATAKDEHARARIWWRESAACSDGDSGIPDLSSENMHLLNPFIVTPELRFSDPRAGNLERARAARKQNELDRAEIISRGRPRKSDEQKRSTKTARQRRFRAGQRSRLNPTDRESPTFSIEPIFPTTAATDSKGLIETKNAILTAKNASNEREA
jgi:hypothetical protein